MLTSTWRPVKKKTLGNVQSLFDTSRVGVCVCVGGGGWVGVGEGWVG